MKRAVALLALLALIPAAFAGCGKPAEAGRNETPADPPAASGTEETAPPAEDAPAAPGASQAADYGWVTFTVPEGFKDVKESEQYVTVVSESDPNQFVRIARDYLMNRTLEQIVRTQVSNDPEKYSLGADATFGGYLWQVVNFRQNGVDNRMFFTLAGDDDHFVRVTAFGLTENDFGLQVLLGEIRFAPEKM